MKHTSLIVTHYSIFKSYNKPQTAIARAKELGAEACVLCDINNVSGAVEFYSECLSNNLKPILGVNLQGNKIFAKNLAGWRKLIQAVTIFNTQDRVKRSLFDDDILVLNEPLDISFYPLPEHHKYLKILRALEDKIKLNEVKENFEGLELKVLDTNLFDSIQQFNITSPPKLPKFSSDKAEIDLLRDLVMEGFEKKKAKIPVDQHNVYLKRIEYEMKVIEIAQLAGYFLIVQDFVNKSRNDGQLCSIARGSSAGCLVSYLIGINLVNPIPYGLLFSRFFNASRAFPKHLSFDEYPFVDEWRDYEKKYS